MIRATPRFSHRTSPISAADEVAAGQPEATVRGAAEEGGCARAEEGGCARVPDLNQWLAPRGDAGPVEPGGRLLMQAEVAPECLTNIAGS